MKRLFGLLVRGALLAVALFAVYAFWLVHRLEISRETIEARARGVEASIVPSIVGGPDGRSFNAQLELPLYLSPERIPRVVADAIVASEDRQFWWHPGINPVAIVRAAWTNLRNWREGNPRRVGASTLTMQLVKNLVLSREQTAERKIDEMIVAVAVTVLFTKSEVLAMYLNTAYFGEGAYGVEVAARKYFGRSVGYEPRLNLYEAALLAKSVKSPSTINPVKRRDVLDARARALLQAMRRNGYPIPGAQKARSPGSRHWEVRPYLFRDVALRSLLPGDIAARTDQTVIGMTIDTEAQLYAEKRADELLSEGAAAGYDSSAIIVLHRDGAIAALATGHGYDGRDVVGVGRVSPGSTLKPFLYLCALRHGARAGDRLRDVSHEFRPGWAPRNADGRFMGRIPLETALIRSRNPPAIELYDRYGWKCFDEELRKAGIVLANPRLPTSVLGSENVSLLALAGAYATLAAGGTKVEPYAVQYARDGKGRLLYRHPAAGGDGLATRAHCDLMKMLRKVVSAKGTGKEAAFSHPVWGKTGTSTDYRDALFVGFTAHYVAAIWLGRQAPGPLTRGITGGDLPAKAFKRLMATLHEGKPVEDIPCAIAVAEAPLAAPAR
ncbi:MAG: transglycosylase domain-containing protein [Bauldia sp.]